MNHPSPDALAAFAADFDANDPLAEYRERFIATPGLRAYLDGNSLGRPLEAAATALQDFVRDEWAARLIRGWDEKWFEQPLAAGDRLAEVVLGAAPGQTFVGDSTTVTLYKLIHAACEVRKGRTELVIERENFPTDRYLVEGIAAARGMTIRWLDAPEGVTVENLLPLLNENTAAAILNHVSYQSAYLADIPALTAAVHAVGAVTVWDLCHSVGAVPLQLDAWGVDFAAGCTYKYLNGGPGSPAFGFVSKDMADAPQPIWGWMGHVDPFAMAQGYVPATGLRRFISGTPPILAMVPLMAMLDVYAEVTAQHGADAVRAKNIALTDFAIRVFDAELATAGFTLASPRNSAERGSHITVDHPRARELTRTLWAQDVIPDFRTPHGIRLGFSALSTSCTEVLEGARSLRDAASR